MKFLLNAVKLLTVSIAIGSKLPFAPGPYKLVWIDVIFLDAEEQRFVRSNAAFMDILKNYGY